MSPAGAAEIASRRRSFHAAQVNSHGATAPESRAFLYRHHRAKPRGRTYEVPANCQPTTPSFEDDDADRRARAGFAW
jgi:hypothetical protein